jgi:membrane fusion protein (multidrug efflux system)
MSNSTIVQQNKLEKDNPGQPGAKKRSTTKIVAWVVVGLAAAAVAAVYYVHSLGYESTDDAFLEGAVIQVSPRVSGQVLRVHVEDNQHVNRGDLLVELDPADYESRLAEAEAKIASASAQATGAETSVALTSTMSSATLTQADAGVRAARDQVDVLRARLAQEEAGVNAARAAWEQAEARQAAATAEAERAASDAVRYQALYRKDEVSKQMLDRTATEARSTAANRDAAAQAVAAAKAQLAQASAGQQSITAALRQSEDQVRQAEGGLRGAQSAPQQVQLRRADFAAQRGKLSEAEAAMQQASLNRSYTGIYASESGYITRKSVEPGNFVGTGQVLMALVSDRYWVVANFKETQLAKMRPGQLATVKVDAYPQLKLKGKVESVQSGTGARFSLIPAENATGNYVKVVQRVPVKIVLQEAPPAEYRLGPGMSVEPEVQVQ